MWNPGLEHFPLYISHPLADNRMTWLDQTDDVKPSRGLLGIPQCSCSSLYRPCYDRLAVEENTWLLRMTETPAPVAPPSTRTPELCSTVPSQAQGSPLELEAPGEERCLEQVQSMVVQEVLKDIDTACKLLNISPDPADWSCAHVQKWLLWIEHFYRLPQVGTVFQELTGMALCSMTEAEFTQRSSQFGDMLYAHLDIWRSAAAMKECSPAGDGKSNVMCSYPSQPIHLWQFLRELLLKPSNYSRCIRWLNKEKGIFKIEDSAHVARLWGIRKNRPAMNYDKLSRSIRQYYKKGIIRKPDVSRRLVYQFVNPV
ncbi:SAM pointed domain-containing Ets transcription factor-like [Thalassophryne amazonica]|uniref:SAM pointed domain-containing Ets transcription factor-like n=1 Tax=Thalassophryne amazonica TaxID=390379 RepID=UPI001471433C|nr:SAM pointed domain-containing Ets transcription factor-like [Thalassophryne amazonica]